MTIAEAPAPTPEVDAKPEVDRQIRGSSLLLVGRIMGVPVQTARVHVRGRKIGLGADHHQLPHVRQIDGVAVRSSL